jgi:hypothetical protein
MIRSKEGTEAAFLRRQRKGEYLVVRGPLLWFAEYPKFRVPILSPTVERRH